MNPQRLPANDDIPAQTGGPFTEEEKRFLIDSPDEIVQILQGMARNESRLTLYYGPDECVLTNLLAVDLDPQRLVFLLPSDADQLERITASPEITFVTIQAGITIKFLVRGVATADHDEKVALVSALPTALMRLQRREFFRMACTQGKPVTCVIPFKTAQGQAQKAEMTVIDLSLGGTTVTNQHPKLDLGTGKTYKDCVIVLPDVGEFTAAIEVRNAYRITMENGTVKMRSGCRFVNPSPDALKKIQRYTHLQAQRSAKVERD